MIWELRHEFKIWLLIDIANIPRSTYYYYSKQFNSPKPDKYADIKTEIRHIYDENKGRYGYRRITQELKKKFVINHKTVQKLMRKMGIFCRVRMHKYNSIYFAFASVTRSTYSFVSGYGISVSVTPSVL